MRHLNLAAIFGIALLTVYFTLENTTSTTVNIAPSASTSLPLAALLLIAAAVGAFVSFLFAGWSGMLRNVDAKELENSKQRIKELEMDLTMTSKRQNVLSFMNFPSTKELDKDVA